MWNNKSPIIDKMLRAGLFFALCAASLILIVKDSLFQKIKISGYVMYVKSGIAGVSSEINYYFNLKKVNEQLLSENLMLRNRIEQALSAVENMDSLILHNTDDADFSYIPAKIISNSTNKLQNFIILDKGSKHGVEPDMGVISTGGVVGVVSSVSAKYSYVISFLNTNQSVSAKITPANAFGPLIWDGRDITVATLTEIPHHIEYSPGDSIYTSGFSTMFPAGIPIGTAMESSYVRGAHHVIRVKLFQDFSTLSFVNIVVNHNKHDIDKIIGKNGNKQQ